MTTRDTSALIQDFLGSTHVFSATINQVVEERVLRAVAGHRLTWQQFKLLRLVAVTDSHSLGDVASFLGVSDAAASKSVDKLVRRRLLHRAAGKDDRREIHLSLTEHGRHVVEAYERARDRKMAELLAGFSPEDLRRTSQLLDRLSATLVEHGADPEQLCLQCGIYFRDRCLVRQLVGRSCYYVRHKAGRRAAVAEPSPPALH
jgi:DNA-binding MarR family transcriptional regulator